MIIKQLLDKQQELDNYIVENLGIDIATTDKKRVLALQVEFFELLNETKAFKFWSKAKPSKTRILEEMVDCYHFLASLVNTYGNDLLNQLEESYNIWHKHIKNAEKTENLDFLNKKLWELQEMIMFQGSMYDVIVKVYEYMLVIQLAYSITDNKILNEYNKKWEENKARQDNGY